MTADTPPSGPTPEAPLLTLVGSGINAACQLTLEARALIEKADRVLYLVNDPVAVRIIERLHPGAKSLAGYYLDQLDRGVSYDLMVRAMILHLQEVRHLCVVFQGHPGVFAVPAHEALRRARAAGFRARLVAGVSAEDCLLADLAVDPGEQGLQSYDATDFLCRRRVIDKTAGLVLWQVGTVGDVTGAYITEGYRPPHLEVLIDVLAAEYGPDHPVTLYRAAAYPGCAAATERLPVARLAEGTFTSASTLYVPPLAEPEVDEAMVRRLGLAEDQLAAQRNQGPLMMKWVRDAAAADDEEPPPPAAFEAEADRSGNGRLPAAEPGDAGDE